MQRSLISAAILLSAAMAAPVAASTSDSFRAQGGTGMARELPPYLQCVPYARQLSGIQIYGDAHTWWKQAAGKFRRGNQPRVGAVMAFRPHRKMRLGHVAAVSKIIDSRTVLLSHSNWSPINGRRGQIENNVTAIDVSPGNDWSSVRVWYHPIQALGKTVWPIHGFIYGDKAKQAPASRWAAARPVTRKSSKAFTSAFSGLTAAAPSTRAKPAPRRVPRIISKPKAKPNKGKSHDTFAAALAKYD